MVDGSWVAADSPALRRALRQDRSAERVLARDARKRRMRRIQAELEDAQAVRRLLEEMREIEYGQRRFTASLRCKVREARPRRDFRRPLKSQPPSRPSRMPRMRLPAIDDRGRLGVFYRQSYVRAGGQKAGLGCARRFWFYTVRDGATLLDADGMPMLISNMGEDIFAIGDAWVVSETAARASRKNAKIQFRIEVALDAAATQGEMVEAVRLFCEKSFGLLDLPYSATIHKPGPDGDARNWHAHILFAHRPLRPTEAGQWEVADDLVTELDGADGVQMLRHLWAHAMTQAAEDAGRHQEYTGLSYAARGLDLQSQTHLGPALAAAVARGDYVAAQQRNLLIAAANDQRLLRRDLAKKRDALIRLRDAVVARKHGVGEVARSVGRRVRITASPAIVRPTSTVPMTHPPISPTMRALLAKTTPPRKGEVVSRPVAAPVPFGLPRLGVAVAPLHMARAIDRANLPPLALSRLDVPRGSGSSRGRPGAGPLETEMGATIRPARERVGRNPFSIFYAPLARVERVGWRRVLVELPVPIVGMMPRARAIDPIPCPRPVGRQPRREAFVDDRGVMLTQSVSSMGRVPILPCLPPVEARDMRPWAEDLDRYLRYEAWRLREDARSRARLDGYRWMPPSYEKAVRAVEAHPQFVVDEGGRPTVAKGVPPEIARAIQAVIDDAHWREFLRRVRDVGEEIAKRSKRPIPELLPEPPPPSTPALVFTRRRRKQRGVGKGRKR